MFLLVELAPEDRKYHRVPWRNMTNGEPTVYEASWWLFGNAAAPFVTQFVLKENARKYAEKYPLGSEVLLKHFYMDDGIQSFRTEQEAIEARQHPAPSPEGRGKWLSCAVVCRNACVFSVGLAPTSPSFLCRIRIESKKGNFTPTLIS